MKLLSHRRLLLVVVAVVLALAAGVWWCWPRTAITEQNFAKIRPGMTLEEVETLLDEPGSPDGVPPHPRWRIWCSDRLMIRVRLDANNRVNHADLHHFETYLEYFRSWLP